MGAASAGLPFGLLECVEEGECAPVNLEAGGSSPCRLLNHSDLPNLLARSLARGLPLALAERSRRSQPAPRVFLRFPSPGWHTDVWLRSLRAQMSWKAEDWPSHYFLFRTCVQSHPSVSPRLLPRWRALLRSGNACSHGGTWWFRSVGRRIGKI